MYLKCLQFVMVLFFLMITVNVHADEVVATSLKLTADQEKKLIELKQNMEAEIQPIWEEIEGGKKRILEIEKQYFSEFWGMLSEEQKKDFAKLNK